MNEVSLINAIYTGLKSLKSGRGFLFKKVIKGTIPPLDAVTTFPSVAFYIAETEYEDNRNYQTVDSEILIYIYNRHKSTGLDVSDINSSLVLAIRDVINKLSVDDLNILESYVSKATHDGGSIFPRTIVELTTKIKYVETKDCNLAT